jgi:hypothetical protein
MCITIAQGALERLYGGCNVIHANSLEKFRADLAGVSQPHVLLYADAPEEGLLALLRRSDLPFAVVTADPIDVVRDLMAERGIDVCYAIRAASLHFSTLDQIALYRKAILIRRNEFEYDVEEVVRKLMNVVACAPDLDQIDGLLSTIFPEEQLDGIWSIERILGLSPSSHLASDDIFLVNEALGDFAHLGARLFSKAIWGRKLFLSMDTGGQAMPDVLSMVGPARFLSYGPYLHLPVGLWSGGLEFKIFDNLGRPRLEIDVFSDKQICFSALTSPVSGLVQFSDVFVVTDAFVALQMRIRQAAGAIEGLVQFDKAWVVSC